MRGIISVSFLLSVIFCSIKYTFFLSSPHFETSLIICEVPTAAGCYFPTTLKWLIAKFPLMIFDNAIHTKIVLCIRCFVDYNCLKKKRTNEWFLLKWNCHYYIMICELWLAKVLINFTQAVINAKHFFTNGPRFTENGIGFVWSHFFGAKFYAMRFLLRVSHSNFNSH